ncbi:MAG: alpha/beta fold hydrolase [Acidobacteriota bacterium]
MIRKLVLLLVVLLIAVNVAFVFQAMEPDRSVEELAARWADENSRFEEIDGAQVHYRDQGLRKGTPLVMLHGLASSLHTWDGWVAELDDDRRLVRLDLPAFGLTGPIADGDYRISRYVRFLDAFLDHLGIEQVDLAGSSFGGYLAWRFALDHPERVRSLVLVSAAGYPPRPGEPVLQLGDVSWIRRLTRNVTPRGLVETALFDVFYDDRLVTQEMIDRHWELLLREGKRDALTNRSGLPRDPERWSRIPEIEQPTLVLWGEEDTWIDPSMAERFVDDLPNARSIVYPEIGHLPAEEAAEASAADLLVFLREQDRSAVESSSETESPSEDETSS